MDNNAANDIKYEMIACVINSGFADTVTDAARKAGARGGTILHCRGSAVKKAQEKFGIYIQPEKDLVLMVVPADVRDAVLHSIYTEAGLATQGQGIVFALPVSRAVGLLKKEGMITVDGNGYICLTEAGEAKAKHIYERHTVLSRLFIGLGVDEETAVEDACRIEHYISDRTFDAVKAHMEKYGVSTK